MNWKCHCRWLYVFVVWINRMNIAWMWCNNRIITITDAVHYAAAAAAVWWWWTASINDWIWLSSLSCITQPRALCIWWMRHSHAGVLTGYPSSVPRFRNLSERCGNHWTSLLWVSIFLLTSTNDEQGKTHIVITVIVTAYLSSIHVLIPRGFFVFSRPY